MNSTAILSRIFFYRIPLASRMKKRTPHGWMIPQYRTLKSKLPKYRLKKSSIPQYRKPPCPPRRGTTHVTLSAYKHLADTKQFFGKYKSLYVTVRFLPCFILYFRALSKYKPPGVYIRRGDLTEGFLRYEFEGLIFGGAYTSWDLFSEFYGNITDYRKTGKTITFCRRKNINRQLTLSVLSTDVSCLFSANN